MAMPVAARAAIDAAKGVAKKATPYFFRETPMVVPRVPQRTASTAERFVVPAVSRAQTAATEAAAQERPRELAVAPKKKSREPAPELTAPPKLPELAQPDPNAALPAYAVKPRGGQWLEGQGLDSFTRSPERLTERLLSSQNLEGNYALADWLKKSLPRYIKRDMGTPNDPLRAVADTGFFPNVENADAWSREAAGYIRPTTRGEMLGLDELFGKNPQAVEEYRKGMPDPTEQMPWLKNVPFTEPVYGLSGLPDPLYWAARRMDEATGVMRSSDLPPELRLDRGSLERMSFPQGVEHAARVNAWRVKKAEEDAAKRASSSALAVHKEYPDEGMKWVEIRAPEGTTSGGPFSGLNADEYPNMEYKEILEELKYDMDPSEYAVRRALVDEGEIMGHCVGDYCEEVLGGEKQIFSLRDAKGEPHVTVEVSPADYATALSSLSKKEGEELVAPINKQFFGDEEPPIRKGPEYFQAVFDAYTAKYGQPKPSIVQIKGKQNRAPKSDYLPFVQDLVKGGDWQTVRELGNANMAQLPDKRFITLDQFEEARKRAPEKLSGYSPETAKDWDPEWWAEVAPYFEGFAVGGMVRKKRKFKVKGQ